MTPNLRHEDLTTDDLDGDEHASGKGLDFQPDRPRLLKATDWCRHRAVTAPYESRR